jgi:hypothetical protein
VVQRRMARKSDARTCVILIRVFWAYTHRKTRPRGHRRLDAAAAPHRARLAARFCAAPPRAGLPRRRAKFRGLRWRVERVRPADSWTWAPGRHVRAARSRRAPAARRARRPLQHTPQTRRAPSACSRGRAKAAVELGGRAVASPCEAATASQAAKLRALAGNASSRREAGSPGGQAACARRYVRASGHPRGLGRLESVSGRVFRHVQGHNTRGRTYIPAAFLRRPPGRRQLSWTAFRCAREAPA